MPCADFERENLLREIQGLRDSLELTEQQPDSPARNSRLSALRMKSSVAKLKLEQFDKDIELLSQVNREERVQEGGRLSCGLAYPGTVLNIGEASLRLEYETRQFSAALVDGEIYLI